MFYDDESLIPHIYPNEYDSVATEFLETYYPDALLSPIPVPILDIAKNGMHLDVQFVNLSEDLDIYGMTVFTDGYVEVYNTDQGVYEARKYKRKTVLIDPAAYKQTNEGCVNNTIAHECVHWYKHRMYYKMQMLQLPRYAKYCKCRVNQLSPNTEEEEILERQAIGIAPRILMPKHSFCEKALSLGIRNSTPSFAQLDSLASFFKVSRQSASIRLRECGI